MLFAFNRFNHGRQGRIIVEDITRIMAAQIAALGQRLDDATLGRFLFELSAAARAKGLDPEGALRRHADGVMRAVEAKVAASGSTKSGGDR
jgi:hypothetical protein